VHASIVLVLGGGAADALRSLTALAALPEHPEHEVVVVDDAAPGAEDVLGLLEGDVAVVRTGRRVGFARAAQLGAERATGDALVVLRAPTEPVGDFLTPLLAALADPAVAVAVPATEGRPAAHPAAAHAVAVRRADLAAAGGVPAVPDALTVAAVALALAPRREVRTVRAGLVADPDAAPVRCGGHLGAPVELTVVIPTLDATSERVRRCIAAIAACTPVPHEVVVVHNGAPPQGFSAPVNAGLRAMRGRYAVVMNDDVEVLDGWWGPLRAALDAGAAVASPVTVDGFNHPSFAAWCFAVARADVDAFAVAPGEFLDPDLRVWFQDTDLLVRLTEAGRPPVSVPGARIRHTVSTTVRSPDPELSAWVRGQTAADERAFRAKHPAVELRGMVVAD